MTINESSIFFFNGGGHDHDGVGSSLIDTSKYSIFDFSFDIGQGNPDRRLDQQNNFESYKQQIINIVNQSVLFPAGIIIRPNTINESHIQTNTITANSIAANTITANEIQAGTITGDLFNATIVLVNQTISSNNYVTGVSGWKIDGDGTAEFDSASIRGAIIASEIIIDDDNFWNSSGFKLGGDNGIYTNDGIVRIGTSVEIEGAVEASELSIDDDNFWNAEGFKLGGSNGIVTINDGVQIGGKLNIFSNGAIESDNFIIFADGSVYLAGEIEANSGFIGSWSIDNNNIVGAEGENGIQTILASSGNNQFGNNVDAGGRITTWKESESAFYALNGGITTNGSSTIGAKGIRYNGPGVANIEYIAFQWGSPHLYGIVDNNHVVVVGTLSDIRFKKNIVDAEDVYAQKLLNNLRIVEFNPHDPKTNKTNMDLKNIGVVAQEAIEAFPDLVKDFNKDGSNEYSLTVNYVGFVPYLIKTVQYLSNKINDLTTRLEALEQ